MANLSQVDRAIIAKHPLESSLTHLHDLLQKVEQTYEPNSTSYDDSARKAISRLLSALLGHEAAFDLRSKTGNKNIASELSTLFGRVQRDSFNYKQYRALARLIIKQAPDIDIWIAPEGIVDPSAESTPDVGIVD